MGGYSVSIKLRIVNINTFNSGVTIDIYAVPRLKIGIFLSFCTPLSLDDFNVSRNRVCRL